MPWGLDQIPGLSADWLVRGRPEGLSSEMARVLGVPDQTDWHHARTGNCGAKIAALLIAVWRANQFGRARQEHGHFVDSPSGLPLHSQSADKPGI